MNFKDWDGFRPSGGWTGPQGGGVDREGNRNLRIRRFLTLAALILLLSPTAGLAWRIETAPIKAVSAILIEPSTRQILYEQNADAPRAPACIAKTTLELVVMEKVQAGELSLDEPDSASAWASKIGGSQVYLTEGEAFPLGELMKAIAIHSANDACVAVAEHVAGTADGFVELMNPCPRARADEHALRQRPRSRRRAGRGELHHRARHRQDRAAADHDPHILEWSTIEEAPFRGGSFLLQNTNKLLGHFPGLDGLKTGYTHKAGFCLCATAERNGFRLISVVLGADSNKARFDETARLLGAGFAQLSLNWLYAAGDPIPGGVPIARGRQARIDGVAGAPLSVILPRRAEPPKAVLIPKTGASGSDPEGRHGGERRSHARGRGDARAPVVAAADMKRETIFQSIARAFGGGRS